MSEGHCGLPRAELIEAKVLEVETGLVEQGIAERVAESTLIEDTIDGQPAVFLGWLFHSERNIAERLSALCAGPLPWSGIDADRALLWVERRPESHWRRAKRLPCARRCAPRCRDHQANAGG
jgi:exodeoxyribonuclease V alpha subunit